MVMRLRVKAPWWGSNNPNKQATCLNFRPTATHDDFFGDGTGSQQQAKHICNGTYTERVCPLREQCLDFALVNNEHYGVWGGLDSLERAYIRKFVPKEEWSYDSAPTREDLEREWLDRIPNNYFEDEDQSDEDLLFSLEEPEEDEREADGEDGVPGGDKEE